MSTFDQPLAKVKRELHENFPHPSYREGQKEAIDEVAEAFAGGYKYVVLDAPTGAGKSAINTAFARTVKDCFYTTPQNNLVDQIAEDDVLSEYYTVLKGKNNYDCQNLECKKFSKQGSHSAEKCTNNEKNNGDEVEFCCDTSYIFRYLNKDNSDEEPPFQTRRELDRAIERDSTCPYPKVLWNSLKSRRTLTNLQLYCIAPYFRNRELTIIDESHNLEQIIFNFVDISITTQTVPFFGEIKDELPTDPKLLENYIENDMKDICLQKLEQIDRSRIDIEKTRRGIDPTKEKEELENLKERRKDLEEKEEKIQNLLDKIKIIENLDEEFVVEEKDESDRVDGVVLKPIYCGDFFEKKIAPMSEKFLLSSATFSNAKKTLEMLGVDRSEVKVISIPSNFPVENRPVHFKDVTSLKYSDKKRGDIGDISTSILNIMQKHNDDKGIVHCGSYSRQRKIIQQLENLGASDRVIEHESSNSEEKFKQFKEAEDNSVLISVAKEEGVDLRQDDARFNVLVKTPNPNTEDIRVNYRINENEEWEWYFNQTAIRVAQCYGRTTRSKDDWSDFYILDSYFQEFYQRNRHLLPQWFIEAAESSSLSAEGRT